MNDQRNKGVCCLEPNPLWPIKVNFDKTPHEIEIDEQQTSPLLTNGFYTGTIELQNKFGTQPFANEFIYAERLMLNSDFVPRVKLPDGVDIKDVRRKIEVNNLVEACQKYGEVLVKLENLKTEAEQHYDADFMKFCQEQGLSSSLKTNDMVLGIFKNKEKVKEYFSNNDNMENLKSFADGFKKMVDVGKSRDEIQNEVLADVGENIKDDLAKILMDDKIRTMLLS